MRVTDHLNEREIATLKRLGFEKILTMTPAQCIDYARRETTYPQPVT